MPPACYDLAMTDVNDVFLTLDEIIQMTGHPNQKAAYNALRRAGLSPGSYRPMPGRKGGPLAEYRKRDVQRVFAHRIQQLT